VSDHETSPAAGQGTDFTVPLDGAWRIEQRALRRDAIGAGMLAVEIWCGNQMVASGCLPVAFTEAWGNRLIEMAADMSFAPGFPNWTRPDPADLALLSCDDPAAAMADHVSAGG